MNRTTLTLSLALALGGIAAAQQQDPFREVYFPPEIVIQHAEELGISEADQQKFHEDLMSRREAFEKAGADQRAASEAFAETLKAHPVDADLAMKQLDAVLAAENAMKRLHVDAMISVRNQLTSEQIAKIDELKKGPQFDPKEQEFVRTVIEPKLKEFQLAMETRGSQGIPPADEVPQLMDEFQQLMRGKQLEQAAKKLEKALDLVK